MESDIDHYYKLETKIKNILNETVLNELTNLYSKLSSDEKKFFTITPEDLKVSWIVNINFTYPNRGDMSTSVLQKIYHSLFKELDNSEEVINFKNTFIEIANKSILFALNSIDSEYFEKFKIDNNFINIFLKEKGKELISSHINKKDDKKMDMFQV